MTINPLYFFSFTGITFAFFLKYFAPLFFVENDRDRQLEYLRSKLCSLERKVIDLEQIVEELESKYNRTENTLIKSNLDLNNKLEEFINYSYDTFE